MFSVITVEKSVFCDHNDGNFYFSVITVEKNGVFCDESEHYCHQGRLY